MIPAGDDQPTGAPARSWRSLRRKSEFATIYEAGVKLVGRLFVLYMYAGDDLARAVVASRKVGGAVERNRAKRILREALASQVLRRPAAIPLLRTRFLTGADAPGLWLVAVARSAIGGARCVEVESEMERLLARRSATEFRSDDKCGGCPTS